MKKLALAALAVVFMAGAVFAADEKGEVNVGLGLALGGSAKYKISNSFSNPDFEGSDSKNAKLGGISLFAEYLYPVLEIVKVGGGFQYLLEREIVKDGPKFSYFPIYLTVQVNPLSGADIKEVFLKGNLGYNLSFTDNADPFPGVNKDEKGGIYYGLAVGYEFPFGLITSLSYDSYVSETKYSESGDWVKMEYNYHIIGFNVGYKFKL